MAAAAQRPLSLKWTVRQEREEQADDVSRQLSGPNAFTAGRRARLPTAALAQWPLCQLAAWLADLP